MLMERNDIQPLVYGKLVGIHRNTLRMKRLITELLDFRKQEQGFEKFKYSKQDIYSVSGGNLSVFQGIRQRQTDYFRIL